MDGSVFVNGASRQSSSSPCRADIVTDPATRAALHAPISKDWIQGFSYPFGMPGIVPSRVRFIRELINVTGGNIDSGDPSEYRA